MDDDWRSSSACRSAPLWVFFPDSHTERHYQKALFFCAQCPVWQECLDFAVQNGEVNGVWGGQVFDTNFRRKHDRRLHTVTRRKEL